MNWENRPTRINFCPVAQAGKEREKKWKRMSGGVGSGKKGRRMTQEPPSHVCLLDLWANVIYVLEL